MRAARSLRLLLVPAVLLAAGCDDETGFTAPDEPPAVEEARWPERATGPLEDLANWADGYLRSHDKTAGTSSPQPTASFNRSGGAMTITKVAGTTGRYVARFKGLSSLLGGKSTVHATGWSLDNSFCKPVGAFLVRDSVEVRCYRLGTGAATNALFSLQVAGKRDDRAFAFANQPATASYSLASAGTWNPTGATKVVRHGVGNYQVTFGGFATRFPAGVGGHVRVNAVGAGKAHCKVVEWGGSPDLIVAVLCFTPAGARADTKFTVMVTPPAAHLAYAWADWPTGAEYTPVAEFSSNPVGGAITISRYGMGLYKVRWTGVDAEIRDLGNVQVMAWGSSGESCKASEIESEAVGVQCFSPNGTLVDANYMVLLGS